jgi:fumarylacetoacetate (FAA) hydrolase
MPTAVRRRQRSFPSRYEQAMKLATLRNGTRDGRLVVVSRDLSTCTDASYAARTLQEALDDWERVRPRLQDIADALEHGSAPAERFHERLCESPLPRAYQWLDGSAYVNHVELVRKARGATLPASFWEEPLMYQGASDAFLGPRDPIMIAEEGWDADFEGEIAVVTGDVPMGATREQAIRAIRLILLCNDVSHRGLIPDELAKGFGFVQSKPSSAFAPVAITPDELGDHWLGGKVLYPLNVTLNGRPFGRPNAGIDMTFSFGSLIAHAAKTRRLAAGTIVGSGTVSNKDGDDGPGLPVAEGGHGYACIAEQRTVETLRHGQPSTPFLRPGDTVRIEMRDAKRRSIFGAIEQQVTLQGG